MTVRSSDDHHAHSGHQCDLVWVGSTVHFSEICAEDLPHLITPVETTDATPPRGSKRKRSIKPFKSAVSLPAHSSSMRERWMRALSCSVASQSRGRL